MLYDLEVVVHCWQYWRLACLQMSSFVQFPPKCCVRYRLCITNEDVNTVRLVEFFYNKMQPKVIVEPVIMDRRRLMRRAIGRNECALTSQAPIVWFADVDYLVTDTCIATILNNFPHGKNLAHPARVHATTKERGMELIESVTEPAIVSLDLKTDFPVVKRSYAIGGLQLFGGDYARKAGYCNDEPRNRIFRPASRWQGTRCDRKARLKAGGSVPMNILALYRVRHSVRSEGAHADVLL